MRRHELAIILELEYDFNEIRVRSFVLNGAPFININDFGHCRCSLLPSVAVRSLEAFQDCRDVDSGSANNSDLKETVLRVAIDQIGDPRSCLLLIMIPAPLSSSIILGGEQQNVAVSLE